MGIRIKENKTETLLSWWWKVVYLIKQSILWSGHCWVFQSIYACI